MLDEMKLLDLLEQNTRASVTDLADILGETEESVEKAKKDLENKGIICITQSLIGIRRIKIMWMPSSVSRRQHSVGPVMTGSQKESENFRRFPACIWYPEARNSLSSSMPVPCVKSLTLSEKNWHRLKELPERSQCLC